MSEFTKLASIVGTPNPYLSLERLRTKLRGRSKSAIYNDVRAGRLPKPMKRGGRVYWLESEVDAALIRLRDDSSASDR